jgi:hypothetical protein
MNVLEAARETMELARQHGMHMTEDPEKPDRSYEHLEQMLAQMETLEQSYGKMCRWLGWMQASVYSMCEGVTLDDLKEINRRHAD